MWLGAVNRSITTPGTPGLGPAPAQRMFVGQVTSVSIGMAWWPALDGTLPDSWNVYRQDFSTTQPYNPNLLPGIGRAPGTTAEYSVLQFFFTDVGQTAPILPNTTYTYWVAPVTGGVVGAAGPTITVTTLAAGPGTTPPTAPTDPALYLPSLPTLTQYMAGTVWQVSSTVTNDTSYDGTPGTSGPLLNVNCSFQYACANATAGDTIVLAAGVTYTSSVGLNGAFLGPGSRGPGVVNGPAWTNIISSEDPVWKAGGQLPAYSFTTSNLYTSFSLNAGALPTAGALSAALDPIAFPSGWTGRKGYFPTLFFSSVAAGFETRMCHYVPGSSTITWNAGFTPTGVGLLTSFAGGTGYAPGTYGLPPAAALAITGGSGTGATTAITVGVNGVGSNVTFVAPISAGSGYAVGDVLSVSNADLGGSGSGLSFTVGSIGGGALVGNVTSATILTHLGNYVTPDDAAAMPTLQFTSAGNSGLGITFQHKSGFIRMIGIRVVPATNQGPGHTSVAAVTMAGNNILLDRCLIGLDTTLSTWSPLTRGVAANGTFNSGHQCFIQGCHYGVPHTLSNTTGDTQAWQWQGQTGVLQNSYAEAVVENIWMGGGTFNGENFIPANLVSRYNYSHKNGAWIGTEFGRYTKNHHEQKCGQFCEAHDNIYQNGWWSQGSAGQNGRVFNVGSIDQVASVSPRKIQSLSHSPTGLITGSCLFYGLAANTNFTTTISGVSNAAYNGTFLCTMTGLGDGAQFTYQLASDPGPPGANTGFLAIVAQACQPWVVVSDFKAYNNQAYGVATFGYPHQDEGQQVNGKNFKQAYVNNLVWINPAGTDNTAPTLLSVAQGFDGSGVEDVTIDHNTVIIIPSQTGNLVTGSAQFTAALAMFSVSKPLSDRWTVTNNILDGHFAFQVEATQAGDPTGTGPSKFNLVFIAPVPPNPLWAKNVTILDVTAGYPSPAGTGVAYSSLFGPGFVNNTTMPVRPSAWNVTQAPYLTASTTGNAVGSIF